LVSVLFTSFNHLDYLEAAWRSVWSQTVREQMEVIVLDDGSTDGSREWLAGQPEPCVRLFHERNLGTYGSLNAGIAVARGAYLAVLNDDDVWAPTKLERQIERLEARPRAGLSHTGGRFIDGDGQTHSLERPMGFAWPRSSGGDVLAEMVGFNRVIASSAVVRRAAVDEVGGFNASFYGFGDWEMWLRVVRRWEADYVDEPLTEYRVHGTNAAHATERMAAESSRIREWIATWDAEPEMKARAGMRRALGLNWASLGAEREARGDRAGARAAYRRAVAGDPRRLKSWIRLIRSARP